LIFSLVCGIIYIIKLNPKFNGKLAEIGEKHGFTKTGVAAAWILRHPANMQLITGTMNPEHLKKICNASDVSISRSEWYEIYRAAGHVLPWSLV